MASSFQELPPSFYVLCSDEFATQLSIPTPVVKEHRDFLCQVIVSLTTESGQCWDAEIEKIGGGYYFTDGWSDFVKDNNGIGEGKLLLFRIVGDSTLHVSIFGHHCWMEPIETTSSCDQMVVARTWNLVKELKEIDFTDQRLNIPRRLAEGTAIAAKCKIVLEDEYGREWPITVTNRNIGVYSLTSGWIQFVRGNELQVGTILLFEFVPGSGNVAKVKAMEKEAGKELLSKAKYGGLICFQPSPNPSDHGGKTWRFVKQLKKYNFTAQTLDIPIDFAVATKIKTRRRIKLEDDSGRKWPITIVHQNLRVLLGSGWIAFLRANKLKAGDILLFEFVPASAHVMKALAMDEKAGRELLSQAATYGNLN